MNPQARLRMWIVAALLPILAAPLTLLGSDSAGVVLAIAVATPGLIAMFWLLLTTPPDAIRLPYLPGLALVLLGSIWVQSLVAVRIGTTDPAWIVWLLVAAWPALTLPVRPERLAVRPPPSPWWMAIPAWSPGLALLGPLAAAEPVIEPGLLRTLLHFGASVTTWPTAALLIVYAIAQHARPRPGAERALLIALWHLGLLAMLITTITLATH